MVVNVTPNIGLAKPTEDELAKDWTRAPNQWHSLNNLTIVDKTDINMIQYTPVLTATTTPPNVGTGTIDGEYCDLQGFVFGSFVIECFDAGITVGLGNYGVSLPFPVDGSFHTVGTALSDQIGPQSVIGEGYYWDNSSVATSGPFVCDVVTVAGVSYMRMALETFVGKTNTVFSNGMPSNIANNDKFTGNFFYKKA